MHEHVWKISLVALAEFAFGIRFGFGFYLLGGVLSVALSLGWTNLTDRIEKRKTEVDRGVRDQASREISDCLRQIRVTDFALSINGLALYASLFFAEALPRTGIAGLLDLQVSRDRLEAESDQPHAPIWRRIAQLVGECDRLSSFGDLKSAALAFDRPPPSVASIAPELCLKFEGILRAELDKHRNAAELRD